MLLLSVDQFSPQLSRNTFDGTDSTHFENGSVNNKCPHFGGLGIIQINRFILTGVFDKRCEGH